MNVRESRESMASLFQYSSAAYLLLELDIFVMLKHRADGTQKQFFFSFFVNISFRPWQRK